MTLSPQDRLLVQRFVDGELPESQRAAVRARLDAEPALAALADELRDLREVFAAERRAPAPLASPGLATRVLAAIAQEPAPQVVAALEGRVVAFARAAILAAALILGVATLIFTGLLPGPDVGRLEASPDTIQRTIEELDARIKADAARRTGDAEPRVVPR